MDEHQNNGVDKFFRDSLRFYKEKPSYHLWAKIESNLDKTDRLINSARMRRRILITACLLLVVSGTSIYTYQSIHVPKTMTIQPNKLEINLYGLPDNIKPLNQPISVNDFVSTKDARFQNSHSFINFRVSGLEHWNQDMGLFTDTGENALHLSTTPVTDSGILLIQKDGTNAISQGVSAEKMIVKPENYSGLNKLSITGFFSQEFAGYDLSDNDATAADGKVIEDRERTAFSASMGLYLNYKVNRRWMIQSGLSYSWSTSDIDSAKSFAVLNNSGAVQFKMNTISGYGYLQYPPSFLPNVGDSILTGKAISRIHYLTLPLILSYRFPMKRFSMLLGAGISFNLLTKAYLETQIYGPNLMGGETATKIKGLKSLYCGIILKADLEYQINNRLGVNLMPTFKNSLSPINIHSALSAYPYNFGLGLGMSYHF
jgi:hypothetical protein